MIEGHFPMLMDLLTLFVAVLQFLFTQSEEDGTHFSLPLEALIDRTAAVVTFAMATLYSV